MEQVCLKCGYMRAKDDDYQPDSCPKCGAVYAKMEQAFLDKRRQASARPKKKPVEKKQPESSLVLSCAACGADVSHAALNCPHCGHPVRVPKRGVTGNILKWSFILFNLYMIYATGSAVFGVGEMISDAAMQDQSGVATGAVAVGGAIGFGVILSIWVLIDIILGALVYFTRPK